MKKALTHFVTEVKFGVILESLLVECTILVRNVKKIVVLTANILFALSQLEETDLQYQLSNDTLL